MPWTRFISLGVSGSPVRFTFPVQQVKIEPQAVEFNATNLTGDEKRTMVKIDKPRITVTATLVPHTSFMSLKSLFSQTKSFLKYIHHTAWTITDDEATSATATTVRITNTSATNITITGVFLSTDRAHAATNYYTGGSFNAATRTVTLGAALPAANTEVLISYTFNAYNVKFAKAPSMSPMKGAYNNYYEGTIELQGV